MTVSEKKEYLIERLNNKDVLVRLEALRGLKRMIDAMTPIMIILLGSVIGPVVAGIYKTLMLMTAATGGM